MLKHVWLYLLFFFYLSTYGQGTDYARKITHKLCSPSFQGRGYVKNGVNKSARFIAKEFKKQGLMAFGGDYGQSFNMPVQRFPGKCHLSLDGKTLIPGEQYLVHPNSAGSQLVKLKIIWVNGAELCQNNPLLAFKKLEGQQNIVLGVNITTSDKDSLSKIKQALEYAARTICPVLESSTDKLIWSVGGDPMKYPYLKMKTDANALDSKWLSISIDAQYRKDFESQNIIGYLPSKTRSDSVLVLCAHYDHLGRMGKNTYFPGANDNASGVAMLLSLIKHFHENPLDKYTLVFMAFAGEEAGLLGSKHFVSHPLFPLKKIKFLLNLDIMGSGEEGITIVNGSVHEKEMQMLKNLNDTLHMVAAIKLRGKAANSDHYPFSELGVPAFFMYTQGPNKHYHDIYDTSNELSFSAFESLQNLIGLFLRHL